MPEITGRVNRRGGITIPKSIRDELGWKTGDPLKIVLQEDGSILFKLDPVFEMRRRLLESHFRVEIGRPLSFTFRPTPPSGPAPAES